MSDYKIYYFNLGVAMQGWSLKGSACPAEAMRGEVNSNSFVGIGFFSSWRLRGNRRAWL